MGIPVIGDLIDGVKDIVSEVVVDKDKRDQVNLELKRLEDQAQARLDAQTSGQIEVNKVEAASSSVFVAGWRPAAGWVGVAGLAWIVLLQPAFSWIAAVVFHYTAGFPVVNMDVLLYTLGGMLGLGGLRTFEKAKGVAGAGTFETTPIATTNTPATTSVDVDTKKGQVTVETAPAPVVKKKKGWLPF